MLKKAKEDNKMSDKLLKNIPKTLQEDFVENRVVPFVGAGFSKNAIAPVGTAILDWDGLGRAVASYIPNYDYTNAIDALSLFETEFSRAKLIEIIAKELKIYSMKPGKAHRAFCALNFEAICTTNFDFLIEQALTESATPFSTIVSEDRLPINIQEKTKVIKMHGDFNHPEHMVITEDDYDCFLDKNKILATYISNMFITKTLLLVGYSLDDYDIRTLWKMIGSRLGKLHSPAYVVLVGANQLEISKFERRNIKVINLPGDKKNYSIILEEFFTEIKSLIDRETPEKIVLTNEKANEEFKMPSDDSKLCFISAPYNRISRLKDILYPILIRNSITPVTLDEVIMRGNIWTRKADLLINKSFMSIVDISDNNANVMWEYGHLTAKGKEVVLIRDKDVENNVPINISMAPYFEYSLTDDNEDFIEALEGVIQKIAISQNKLKNQEEHFRLLQKGEYNAAVISVFRFLEITLTNKFGANNSHSALMLLRLLNTNTQEDRENLQRAREYLSIRNKIVHTDTKIRKKKAFEIVECIASICRAINNGRIIML